MFWAPLVYFQHMLRHDLSPFGRLSTFQQIKIDIREFSSVLFVVSSVQHLKNRLSLRSKDPKSHFSTISLKSNFVIFQVLFIFFGDVGIIAKFLLWIDLNLVFFTIQSYLSNVLAIPYLESISKLNEMSSHWISVKKNLKWINFIKNSSKFIGIRPNLTQKFTLNFRKCLKECSSYARFFFFFKSHPT